MIWLTLTVLDCQLLLLLTGGAGVTLNQLTPRLYNTMGTARRRRLTLTAGGRC